MPDDTTGGAITMPNPVTLHCGQAILDYLRDRFRRSYGGGIADLMAGVATLPPLTGVPIVPHDSMHRGAWQLRNPDGDVIRSGQIGADHEQVHYIPGGGFVGFDITIN